MTTDRANRRGISLMMVTAVVAVASVLGMAILSGNALQAQASANQHHALQADALAESGVNLGLYYLQNVHDPTKCPIGVSSLAAPPPDAAPYSRTGITIGADVHGTIDLSVRRLSASRYAVTSTGRATGGVTRQMSVTADVNYYGYAVIASNPTTGTFVVPAGSTINGDVYSSVPVTNNGTVSGRIFANSAAGASPLGGVQGLLGLALPAVPPVLQVNHYATYVHNGVPGVAELLPPGGLGDNETRGPTALNPAGVYYTAGHLAVGNNVTVNGTLVAVAGQVRVQGANVRVTPAAGFPAIVSDQDLSFRASNATLQANGLTYVGGRVVRGSGGVTGARLTVNGALLFGSTVAGADPAILTTINFDRARAAVPSLNLAGTPAPASVSIASFTNNK
jgi:Tfp pilus assembly protein PilX